MIIYKQLDERMKKRIISTFSPEFRLEAFQLVVDQNYTVREAAKSMNVGVSTMTKLGGLVETRTTRQALCGSYSNAARPT